MSEAYHTPGSDWLFAVGPELLVALDPTLPSQVVEDVWRLVRKEDATLEGLVASIPLAGDTLYSFAIVAGAFGSADTELDVTAVVRGSAVVDIHSVGGSRRFGAQGAQPWLLADFGSVVAVTATSAAEPAVGAAKRIRGSLPVERGVVSGSQLVWSARPLTAGAEADSSGGFALDELDGVGESHDLGELHDRELDDLGELDDRELDDLGELDDTVLSSRGARTNVAPQSVPDEETVISRRNAPARVRPEPPVVDAVEPRFTLRFTDGTLHTLDTAVLVGRQPRNRRAALGEAPRTIPVPSPGKSVSSTHVRFEPSGSSVTVTDEYSTNGTIVTPFGQAGRKLRPGDSLAVAGEARVELGDGIIIEILPPEQR